MKGSLYLVAALSILGGSLGNGRADNVTWSGSGSDGKWSNPLNWADNVIPVNDNTLTFTGSGSGKFNLRNDASNLLLGGIIFDAQADAFTFAGKPIKLAGNIVNNSKNPQAFDLYITLTGNRTLTTSDGGDMSIGGTLKGDKFGITKEGPGKLTLSVANSYMGQTVVRAGTLVLGSASALNSASTIVLNGGTLAMDDTVSPSLGALKLASNSILDFGTGAHKVIFANSSSQPWTGTLSIYNWNKATDSLEFGTDKNALTAEQLKQISFYSDSGTTLLGIGCWTVANSSSVIFTAAPAQ